MSQKAPTACEKMDYANLQAQSVSPVLPDTPSLIAVVDTEEEFDWEAQPDSAQRRVSAIDYVDRAQSIFDAYGIVPCYVIGHPIAVEPLAFEKIKGIAADGRCSIGAHLHPWVNPPFAKELQGRADMYPGNLPYQEEYDKLALLTETITRNLGVRPKAYKAGRYGFGPNTQRILHQLGYEIDLSFCPPIDFRLDGGPDYSACSSRPFWLESDQILEIPISGAYTGLLQNYGRSIYDFNAKVKLQTFFSRLRLLDRLVLSPEGFSADEHVRLTRHLYDMGIRVFTWSFHSTSLKPGCAPYVSSEQDLSRFLALFRKYFDFFFTDFGGQATTAQAVRDTLLKKQHRSCGDGGS